MRAVIQRVNKSEVLDSEGNLLSQIGKGVLVLLGVGLKDDETNSQKLAARIANLRIFEDDNSKMNFSLLDQGYEALVVSQFTLYADTEKGRRPSFTDACEPNRAKELYERFVSELRYLGVKTKTGVFGAKMLVRLDNDGPVTFIIEG